MTTTTPPHPHHEDHHGFIIDTARLSAIHDRIAKPPTILSKSAGRSTCSIYKVPDSFKEANPKLYNPHIVSIGPFYHGQAQLQMMEEHKYQYLGQLLTRTARDLKSIFAALAPLEAAARECYSEPITRDAHDHLEMLVVDGCFVVELFRKVAKRVGFEPDDPIASMSWVFPSLLRDLHRLENQIPFFVLQRVFDLTYMEEFDGIREGEGEVGPTFAMICLDFFNYTLQRPPEVLFKYKFPIIITPTLISSLPIMTTTTTPPHPHHEDHHGFIIDTARLSAIHDRIAKPPTILSKSAGRSTCSIYKVPDSFKEANPKLYNPHIVSIGPFYHGQAQLQMMEEHKYQYLGQLLTRTARDLNSIFAAVAPIEAAARECYSEPITHDAHDHLEMLVVDGCFVVELFRKVAKRVGFEPDDPIASMSWVFPSLLRDLHRLENQIPFFVLQRVFDLTYMEEFDGIREGEEGEVGPTFAMICLDFFNYTLQRPPEVLFKYKDLQPKHLLDLLRSSFITPGLVPKESKKRRSAPSHVILPVSKLRQAGIHLKQWKSAETFLEIKFKSSGTIEMPKITLDDFMSSLLANCVAYEQCHNGSTYFTTYAALVDCLVNTAKDVEYLCDKNIIENYFGTEAEIATYINNLGKDVAFHIDDCYLNKLFGDVNVYYKNNWHVRWASLKYTYFETPWSFISALAAFVLLVLTVLQTVYTVMPYYTQN